MALFGLQAIAHHLEKLTQKPEAGTGGREHRKTLISGLLPLAFLYNSEMPTKGSSVHCGLCSLPSVNHQENALQKCL